MAIMLPMSGGGGGGNCQQFQWYLCAVDLEEASDMREISLFLNGIFMFAEGTEDPKKCIHVDILSEVTNFSYAKEKSGL